MILKSYLLFYLEIRKGILSKQLAFKLLNIRERFKVIQPSKVKLLSDVMNIKIIQISM